VRHRHTGHATLTRTRCDDGGAVVVVVVGGGDGANNEKAGRREVVVMLEEVVEDEEEDEEDADAKVEEEKEGSRREPKRRDRPDGGVLVAKEGGTRRADVDLLVSASAQRARHSSQKLWPQWSRYGSRLGVVELAPSLLLRSPSTSIFEAFPPLLLSSSSSGEMA
jgi:hypothetical protein